MSKSRKDRHLNQNLLRSTLLNSSKITGKMAFRGSSETIFMLVDNYCRLTVEYDKP